MVNLTRIYTRTGDEGQTTLSDMSRTAKTDPRVEAYGAVDEANSLVGLVLAQADLPAVVAEALSHVQNELFDVGTDLSNPYPGDAGSLRVIQDSVDRLEDWCDELSAGLPELRSFVLPGGSQTAATLHVARAVVRRAEREAWRVGEDQPGTVNPLAIKYLNRLSDLLFVAARMAAQQAGEVLWIPGKDRETLTSRAARQRERISQQQQKLQT
ncbi:MAG: cob(I)yrinic acid a,c-diamide adenosyltransferase [Propionibacteriaceae bacterium]|jgi:cob(I)alamin adenosyltransferase|nr:cob(I)yrinic acid a,c-diamide adenosyltransferase [Propionibacteriaceae bacterium]